MLEPAKEVELFWNLFYEKSYLGSVDSWWNRA